MALNLGTLRVYRSHFGLRNPNRQELCQGQVTVPLRP